MLKPVILVLALLGSPLFVVISALALLSFYGVGIDPTVVVIEMSRLSDTPACSWRSDSPGRLRPRDPLGAVLGDFHHTALPLNRLVA